MGNDTDPVSAARRVAEALRDPAAIESGAVIWPRDCAALLPFLDAVAAGPDADRLERWARAMCRAAGHTDPDQPYAHGKLWEKWSSSARAAIALADAEEAGRDKATLAVLRQLEWIDGGGNECAVCFGLRTRGHEAGCALDAVVRALAGR